MASFALLVTSSPTDGPDAWSALQFAESAIASGHNVKGIFFYLNGVSNANSMQLLPGDEANLYQRWVQMAETHNVPLSTCITAANRRGVISAQDAEDADLSHFNLTAPFTTAGLGELVELTTQVDRLVQF